MARTAEGINRASLHDVSKHRAKTPYMIVARGPWVKRKFGNDRKAEYCKTLDDAKARLAWWKAQFEGSMANTVPLSSALDAYLRWATTREKRPLRESTAKLCRWRINPLVELTNDKPIGRITRADIEARLETIPSALGRAGTRDEISRMFDWLKSQGALQENPCKVEVEEGKTRVFEVTGKPRAEVQTMTRVEARRFAKACAELYQQGRPGPLANNDGHGSKRDREHALVGLLYLYLGTRSSELLRRRVEDLDLSGETGVLSIPLAKTKAGVRELALPPMLKLLLLEWLNGRTTGWLFPAPKANDGKGHRGPTFARGAIERLCKLAKLVRKDDKGNDVPLVLTVHEMRKTNAQLDRQLGTQAERIQVGLGHESSRITKQAYIGTKVEAEAAGRQARDLIGEWLEGLAAKTDEPEKA